MDGGDVSMVCQRGDRWQGGSPRGRASARRQAGQSRRRGQRRTRASSRRTHHRPAPSWGAHERHQGAPKARAPRSPTSRLATYRWARRRVTRLLRTIRQDLAELEQRVPSKVSLMLAEVATLERQSGAAESPVRGATGPRALGRGSDVATATGWEAALALLPWKVYDPSTHARLVGAMRAGMVALEKVNALLVGLILEESPAQDGSNEAKADGPRAGERSSHERSTPADLRADRRRCTGGRNGAANRHSRRRVRALREPRKGDKQT